MNRTPSFLPRLGLVLTAVLALGACDSGTSPDTPLSVDALSGGDGPSSTATSAEACDGTLGAIEVEEVNVPDGATCVLDGTRVDGNVFVRDDASLRTLGAYIEGNIHAEDALEVRTGEGTFVGGNIQVKRRALAWIEDTTIDGDLQVEEGGAALEAHRTVIGGNLQFQKAASATVEDSGIDGDLQMQENRGALAVFRTDVRGNLQAFKNSGGVTLVDNRIDQTLQCGENEPAPTGSGNVAGEKEGQCGEL